MPAKKQKKAKRLTPEPIIPPGHGVSLEEALGAAMKVPPPETDGTSGGGGGGRGKARGKRAKGKRKK